MSPLVEFSPYEVAIQGGDPYTGHEGIRRWWQELFEVLTDVRNDVEDVRDLGGRTTLAIGHLRGEGAGSGARFERPECELARWRDGKLVWWCAFQDEAEALEAVSLRE